MPAVRSPTASLQRGDVVGRHELHARQQRLEIVPVLGLPGDRERAQRAAVEGVLQRDDLVLVGADLAAVRADHLQRAFHGLGAGVGEEAALEPADLGQPLGQRSLVLVVVEVRRVDQQAGLLADDLHDARMRVAERVDADAGDQVQVALAR